MGKRAETMAQSEELLISYAETTSETKFRELVERHIEMVYGTARRIGNGDVHFAEDITQMVFRDLARKAHQISEQTILAGWLYRHTCFMAWKNIRAEDRRRKRERIAMEMHQANSPADSTGLMELQTVLDGAMAELTDRERN